MSDSIVSYEIIKTQPVNRAAYSDRTAGMMALMSKLAYIRFEGATSIGDALTEALALITGTEDPVAQENTRKISSKFQKDNLKAVLKKVANASGRKDNYGDLETGLRACNFTVKKVFDVNIPLIADTQAFLAQLAEDGRDPFLILAFRGTDPKSPTDIKTDLEAKPMTLGALGGTGGSIYIEAGKPLTTIQETWPKVKVHPGFWKAYKAVEKELNTVLNSEELKDMPLYITGHSLGGALAIVATYALEQENDRIAACYTFGGPRVGNLQFGQRIKAPVYRVINASDIVPRVPPGVGLDIATIVLRAIPVVPYLDKLADFLERFRGYRHYGDMRYLNAVDSAEEEGKTTYPGLIVRANPPQISRWYWLVRRWVATGGRAAVGDHSIDTYVEKLAYWAYVRSL